MFSCQKEDDGEKVKVPYSTGSQKKIKEKNKEKVINNNKSL